MSSDRSEAAAEAKLINTLRLVVSANLPPVLERAILAYVPPHELTTLLRLSKDMQRLVSAHLPLLSHFTIVLVEQRDGLSLLGRLGQLRSLKLGVKLCKNGGAELQVALVKAVERNAATIEKVQVSHLATTLPLLRALQQCPRLALFHDTGAADCYGEGQKHIKPQDAYDMNVLKLVNLRKETLRQLRLEVSREYSVEKRWAGLYPNDVTSILKLGSFHAPAVPCMSASLF